MARAINVYDTMYEWSKGLEDDHIGEDQHEQEVRTKSGRERNVNNQIVTVRGKLEGVPVVVSWQTWWSTGFSSSDYYVKHVLDVFITAKSIDFDARMTLRKTGFFAKFFGKKGVIPIEHTIFEAYKFTPETVTDFSFLNFARCDAFQKLHNIHHGIGFEFQANTGCSMFAQIAPQSLDGNFMRSITSGLLKAVS